jgi:hypothetical protein
MSEGIAAGVNVPAGGYGPAALLAEYRMGPEFRRPVLVHFALNFAGTVLLTILAVEASPVGYVLGSVTAAAATYYGIAYLWRGRFRTRVTARGIEARGYRNHVVPWDQVRGIEIGGWSYGTEAGLYQGVSRGGFTTGQAGSAAAARSGKMARIATVKVVRADGKKVLLRAPLVTGWASDPYFNDKARQLQDLARQHAGMAAAR